SIECGMPAADGAIHEVRLSDDLRPEYSVIGGQRPLGLCGSGVVSLLSEMRRVGILNEGGSIDRSVRSDRIGTIGHSAVFYVVYPDVYLSQLDIRMLQLSKAAVQAGILTLLNEAGYRCQDIRSTLITGAFGNALRIDDAIGIGMLPRLDRVVQRECAALDGATLMLIDDDARETADDLRRRSRHVSLRDNPVFEQLFEQSRVFAPWVSI
ncbi:MAG: ASKHA domain-containing protein, partial [Candidatus Thorarchaeota archaeon]